jgi:predicted RNase H-like HicB family nuclease
LTPATAFGLKVEFSRERDGRWIADVPALPGVTVYGRTRKKAFASVELLALRVIVDRLANGEAVPGSTLSKTATKAPLPAVTAR